jgi:periplasmic divalent cation tolerance protein
MACKVCTAYYIRDVYNFEKYLMKIKGPIMAEFIQVLTTVEHKADAEKIVKSLVEKKLAACAQILGPLTSYFHWQGKLDSAQEYLCLIKSRDDLFPELEAAIKSMHPYEVPEILATPITMGGKDYLNWLAAELKA